MTLPHGVAIQAPLKPGFDRILTADALALVAKLHRAFDPRRKELLAQRGALATDYPNSVATTWSISFQKVEEANPAAAELLQLCAFLAPDRIPEELHQLHPELWARVTGAELQGWDVVLGDPQPLGQLALGPALLLALGPEPGGSHLHLHGGESKSRPCFFAATSERAVPGGPRIPGRGHLPPLESPRGPATAQ